LKAVIGSLAMALGVSSAITVWVAMAGERSIAREAIGVIGAAAIGAGIYLGALLLLRAPEIRSIGRLLLRRRVA
jgi:hypothetical protein